MRRRFCKRSCYDATICSYTGNGIKFHVWENKGDTLSMKQIIDKCLIEWCLFSTEFIVWSYRFGFLTSFIHKTHDMMINADGKHSSTATESQPSEARRMVLIRSQTLLRLVSWRRSSSAFGIGYDFHVACMILCHDKIKHLQWSRV